MLRRAARRALAREARAASRGRASRATTRPRDAARKPQNPRLPGSLPAPPATPDSPPSAPGRRLPVQGEYGGGRPVARGELFLLSAPEQGPPPVAALGREEKLELALVGRDPVLRESPQHPRCDAEVIRMLSLGKAAPAGTFGAGHGAEILLDQFGVDPARVVRIVFPERDEDLGRGPGLAGELSFPVQALVERRGKLFRLFADGPARFSRKRNDPVRSEYHAAIAAGRFRKNRRESGH